MKCRSNYLRKKCENERNEEERREKQMNKKSFGKYTRMN